jgi:hypothetical protein
MELRKNKRRWLTGFRRGTHMVVNQGQALISLPLISSFFYVSCFSPCIRDTTAQGRKRCEKAWKRNMVGYRSGATVNMVIDCFFPFNLPMPVVSWSQLWTTCMNSQTECIRRALRIYNILSSIRATDKDYIFLSLIKLIFKPCLVGLFNLLLLLQKPKANQRGSKP